MVNEEVEALKRILDRQRSARKIAEKILEEKSSELYNLNQTLIKVNASLEEKVKDATQQLELIARFPAENPFPVMRTDRLGHIKYLNKPAKKLIQTLELEGINTEELFESWTGEGLNTARELITFKQAFLVQIVPVKEHDYVNFYFSETTEQKLAEAELVLSEEKYRSVIENMKLGLLEVNNENLITRAYTHFCNITGYSEEELLGEQSDNLVANEESEFGINPLFIEGGGANETLHEARIKRKDGSYVWVLISSTPLFGDTGERIGSMGIHLDITQQKENEIELRSARFIAEESTKAKEQFLANMSHEIRTPLNAISGMTDLLINTDINNEQEKLLTVMERSSQNLLVVINDILDLSKIESGNLKFEKIGFRLEDVIKHVVITKKIHADEKGLMIESSIPNRVGRILLGDPFRLNQILLNFVNNAIKFTEDGGIKIIVKSISEDEQKEVLQFNIIDTGKGIASEKVHSIFEAFQQEDESITRSYGGTGLGLTITKKMIEMQEGVLTVASELTIGSDFQFIISYEIGQEADLPENKHTEVDTSLLKGLKILIAEDNEFNQILMSTLFHQFDLQLTIVDNGEKALNSLKEEYFDIVLMDIQMPVMGGLQATKLIRQDESIKNTPILALTANAFKDELEKYKAKGMDDCLSKPFKSDELYSKILNLTGRVSSNNIPIKRKDEEVLLYDLTKLAGMLGNNQELVSKMVQSFLKHTPPLLDDLFNASGKKDWNQVSKICHRLKASYKTMSIHSLANPIHLLEIEIMKLPDSDKKTYLESIKKVSDKVFKSLESEGFHNLE